MKAGNKRNDEKRIGLMKTAYVSRPRTCFIRELWCLIPKGTQQIKRISAQYNHSEHDIDQHFCPGIHTAFRFEGSQRIID